MLSIGAIILQIVVRHPTLINLHLPLTSLVGIISKRKKHLTCTHEAIKVKIEQLHSARLIIGD
jgi:hypothetical protein